jgi:transcriptional regulator with XRE-family HTH domain
MTISPKKIRKARKILGLTQVQTGTVLGNVSPGRISRWEHSPEDKLPTMKDPDPITINLFIQLAELLVEFFSDKADRERFFQTPKLALGGETSLEVIMRDPPNGLRDVVQFLGRLERGIIT